MWPFKNKELEALNERLNVQTKIMTLFSERLNGVENCQKENHQLIKNQNVRQIFADSKISEDLIDENEQLKLQNKTQADSIEHMVKEVQALHYEMFQLKASHEISNAKNKLEQEEQKYNEFIALHNRVIENNQAANKALTELVIEKLKEVQIPSVIVQNGELKSNVESGYKSI